jgi:hypothetical protein
MGNPPPEYLIPVTLGADFAFSIVVTDTNSNPVDLSAAVFQVVLVKGNPPTTISGVVSTNTAAFVVPSTLADQTKNSTMWQICITTVPGTIPIAVAVGKFERHDG